MTVKQTWNTNKTRKPTHCKGAVLTHWKGVSCAYIANVELIVESWASSPELAVQSGINDVGWVIWSLPSEPRLPVTNPQMPASVVRCLVPGKPACLRGRVDWPCSWNLHIVALKPTSCGNRVFGTNRWVLLSSHGCCLHEHGPDS